MERTLAVAERCTFNLDQIRYRYDQDAGLLFSSVWTLDPGHMGFHNGPIRGTDVFVPVENIIGGVEGVGRGWPMLMECLTDGRAISLPALSCAAAKTATRVVGAYSRIRYQFHTPIVGFEGVREALAAIAGVDQACSSRLLRRRTRNSGPPATTCVVPSSSKQNTRPSRVHGDAQQPEGQQQQPHHGIEDQRQQGQGPAQHQQDEPQKELRHVR